MALSAAQRSRIADEASAVIRGEVRLWDWVNTLSDEELNDPLVEELIDILTHEPKVGGFLGVSREVHEHHMAEAHAIIALLRER